MPRFGIRIFLISYPDCEELKIRAPFPTAECEGLALGTVAFRTRDCTFDPEDVVVEMSRGGAPILVARDRRVWIRCRLQR